jgi:radical SAM protein with 4Fe4S-binding SPASM domain
MNKMKQIASLGKIFANYKKRNPLPDSLPIRLWIEPASICNLKCIMCLNKDAPPSEKGIMEWELYKKIIDEVKDYVYDVYLHHRGEPLMHPEFPRMIEYARSAGLKVKFHTNGTLMKPALSEKILEAGPDLVSFSVDGFTKEAYEKIRVNADFEKTMENISAFLQKKKEKGLTRPYTIVEEIDFPQFRTPADEANRKDFSARFRELGLDEMIFKKLYNWAGYLKMDGMEKGEITYTACTFLWYAAVILWNGEVSPCPQDYFAKLKLGNLKNHTLREIWAGEAYEGLRKKMASGIGGISPCSECDRLARKKVGGIPFQYLFSYLNDNITGYGRLRKLLGSYERNE